VKYLFFAINGNMPCWKLLVDNHYAPADLIDQNVLYADCMKTKEDTAYYFIDHPILFDVCLNKKMPRVFEEVSELYPKIAQMLLNHSVQASVSYNAEVDRFVASGAIQFSEEAGKNLIVLKN
jgi:hypothetical protein